MPTFTLSIAPQPVIIAQGATGMTTVAVVPVNGFDQDVTLIAFAVPTGVTASFSPNPTTTSSTLTLDVSSSAETGVSSVAVTGTSGGLSQTITFVLRIAAAN
jgi:hypothetical protein